MAQKKTSTGDRVRILFVDASDDRAQAFEQIVSAHMADAELRRAASGEEARRLVEAGAPNCALVHIELPDESGASLCRFMKAGREEPFPVLLFTSAPPDPAAANLAFEAGADDFHYQGCSNLDVVAKLRALMRVKHAEDRLRSVNKRLADVAGQRSRALHEFDERFRHLFHATRDAVFMLEMTGESGEGRFIEVNKAACDLVGYSRDELLQMGMADLVTPDRARAAPGRIASILNHKQVCFETELVGRDDKVIPVTLDARVFDYSGSRTIVSVVYDRRPHDWDDEGRYGAVAAETGQMIYDRNIRTGRIKWAGAVTKVGGYTPEEMQNRNWKVWRGEIHEEDAKRIRPQFREAVQSVGTYHLEYRIRHRSGEYRYMEDMGVVLPDEDGRAYRVVGTMKDITTRVRADDERRRLEQEQQHSQKLESLGVLAGGIAHDFNNILGAIIGLTDMAVQDIPEDSPTHQDLREALQAAHRAKELVKQILTFSRQSGEERSALYLHVVVREALKLLRASLPANIDIVDSVDVHSGAVMANPTQMHQVIMNYCTNSAQAMKDAGGTLEVKLVDVDLSEEDARVHHKLHAGPYVKLSVIDTGHGMEQRVIERIFDPFFTTKGPGEGTGMGLAVVHGIVSSHGGAIAVESVRGQGTTLHTYLPRVAAQEHAAKPKPEKIPAGTETLLFVDDEESILRFGQSILPRLGYNTVFCKNGIEALKIFREEPGRFDLVITDQLMPQMSGLELAAAVREERPDLPIILFTGFSESITAEKIAQLGIEDVVLKPVIAVDLAKRIRKVLDGRPAQTTEEG